MNGNYTTTESVGGALKVFYERLLKLGKYPVSDYEKEHWVFIGDIDKCFPKISCNDYEELLKKHPELRLCEMKVTPIEIIEAWANNKCKADSCDEQCDDDNNKPLNRNEAFKGIFNKRGKRWG